MSPFVVMACRVLEPLLAPRVSAEAQDYLDYGLHLRPAEMRPELQRRLDALPEPSTVIIGYGLCGNGVVGVESGPHTLVMPRTHDCIGMMLGSRHMYEATFLAEPGTYYLTRGWLESGDDPLTTYEALVDRHGAERAGRLIDKMYGSYRRLRLLAFSETEMEGVRLLAAPVAEFCQDRWNMQCDEHIGDAELIDRLASASVEPDPDLLVVPPGSMVTQEMYLADGPPSHVPRSHM